MGKGSTGVDSRELSGIRQWARGFWAQEGAPSLLTFTAVKVSMVDNFFCAGEEDVAFFPEVWKLYLRYPISVKQKN